MKANKDDVVSFLTEILPSLQQEFIIETTERALTQIERDRFLINYVPPSILSCAQVTKETTEIYFNSFSCMKEISSALSEKIGGFVVVNIYQNTASAGYWAYHLNGKLLREIEFGDGENSIDSGVKFGFEEDQIGHNTAESDENEYIIFDCDDIDLYNQKVGLDVEVYQSSDSSEWTNFRITNHQKAPELPSKKWWKFWA